LLKFLIFAEVRMRVRILCLLSVVLIVLAGCAPAGPATPTPKPAPAETATPAPVDLVKILQEYLNNMDPVGAVLDANFTILDVAYEKDAGGKERVLDIHINCDDQGNTCGPERSFSVVVMALKEKKKKLPDILPRTLTDLQVYTYDHLAGTGVRKVGWQDVKDFNEDVITGAQLAARVVITR
jgi:hypothetical protein